MNVKNKRILIVVAHPDDELLGLGATMNKWINEENILTHVVILGEGITSRDEVRNLDKRENDLTIHKKNIFLAKSCIGYHSVKAYNFPDNRFDSVSLLDIIKVVEYERDLFKPDIVFTHHGGDINIDHRLTFQAVITAFRPLSQENCKTIITFETASGTEWRPSTDPMHFIPNFYVSLSLANLKAKIDAMECYEFEKRVYPHPRSPKALTVQSQKWGITVGYEYAEAFCIVRHIM